MSIPNKTVMWEGLSVFGITVDGILFHCKLNEKQKRHIIRYLLKITNIKKTFHLINIPSGGVG